MWYFGPFAFALAIPAAARDAWRDNPKSAQAHWSEKLANTSMGLAQFFTSQTPLGGVNNFFRVLSGEEEMNTTKAIAFSLGQFIPAGGFVRWVNTIIDPHYRKSKGFFDTFKKDLPILSQSLDAHKDATGSAAIRDLWTDTMLPFAIGKHSPEYEGLFQDRRSLLQNRAMYRKQVSDMMDLWEKGKLDRRSVIQYLATLPKDEIGILQTNIRQKWPEFDLPDSKKKGKK